MINFEDIKPIIENASGTQIDLSKLDNKLTLTELGLDSLDTYTILIKIEETYKFKIPDEHVDELDNIHSLISYINEYKNI
jgi:acyl carrier protein